MALLILFAIFISFFLNAIANSSKMEIGTAEDVRLTIVYDNNAYDERLETAWGFGCYIQIDNVTVLFDTGGDVRIPLSNMAKLNLPLEEIDVVVISHIHGDHTGGLFKVLELNSKVKVYLPASFPIEFKERVREYGCELIEIKNALKICSGLATVGELNGIKEQSLIVSSSKGLIMVTGCAHPGIVNVLKKAKELTGRDIYLAIGGFHLSRKSEKTILSIIEELKRLGVKKVAPCHCSGDLARRLFKGKFGEDYIEAGVGARYSFSI
jgi:7,8-dihydropterin-6-yl-methyl-4-(beta-D-ribofuranosyl)aminobenzene 5'-phosphate synthase